ncbi:MAG TPA: AraC family transcriptional regulator [Cyclobacteriaceae bacterium]|nr:AraC family transcriptional regulator [Cyclobacteriaceae bacterium]
MEETYPKFYLYKRIVQAKLYMDSNFAERADLNNIADEAYFSKFHFIRLFKKIYGKTPHQYLILVRIEKAKELLQNGISITEVCSSIGFESVSSFAGLFKRYVKVTPSTYQLEYQLRQEQIKNTPLKFIPNCFAEQKGWTKNSNFEEVS